MSLSPRRVTQLRRRPPQSEGVTAKPLKGWVPLRHEQLLQLMVLAKGAELPLVLYVMSSANQRNNDGRADGWTGILQTAEICEKITYGERMVNKALARMIEIGVLEKKTVKQAASGKLVTRGEARGAKYFGTVLRARISEWERLAKQELAAAEAAEEEDLPAEEDSETDEVRLAEAPVLAEPGRPCSIPLSVGVLRRCDAIEITGLPVALSFDPVLRGRSLQLMVAGVANVVALQGNDPVLRNSSAPLQNKALTEPWRNDSDYLRLMEEYEASGKPLIDKDKAEGFPLWQKLSYQERAMAVENFRDRVQRGQYDDPTYIHLPKNYLEGEWSRKTVKRRSKRRLTEEQELAMIQEFSRD